MKLFIFWVVLLPALWASGPLKILVIGAHPDDPETCAGGLVALAAKGGHQVTVAYLTAGEAGIKGKTHAEAAAIRRQEGIEACETLGATPVFLGQIDGDSVVNREAFQEIVKFLEAEKPDLVVTHWPIDSHADHRACWSLVFHAWWWGGKRFPLYYMEAMTGQQSTGFMPTDRLDISSVVEVKHRACFAHRSQDVTPETYHAELLHGDMERQRGREAGFSFAEAFVRQDQSVSFDLSRLTLGSCAGP
jgi:LmbE family N-acetylglucosaminyl deacetylase